jgi:hypothetical protein
LLQIAKKLAARRRLSSGSIREIILALLKSPSLLFFLAFYGLAAAFAYLQEYRNRDALIYSPFPASWRYDALRVDKQPLLAEF